MLESASFSGEACIVAHGKQLASDCPVSLKFFVDEEEFVHLKRFHQQARDASFIPGMRLRPLYRMLTTQPNPVDSSYIIGFNYSCYNLIHIFLYTMHILCIIIYLGAALTSCHP